MMAFLWFALGVVVGIIAAVGTLSWLFSQARVWPR